MREIKFRAWDNREKSMLQAVAVLTPEHHKPYYTGNEIYIHPMSPDYVLMQFTGLKDKNGVEIYEGDMLRISADYFEKIYYNDCGEKIEAVWHSDDSPNVYIGDLRDGIIPRVDLAAKFYQVIGNIYESPELCQVNDRDK